MAAVTIHCCAAPCSQKPLLSAAFSGDAAATGASSVEGVRCGTVSQDRGFNIREDGEWGRHQTAGGGRVRQGEGSGALQQQGLVHGGFSGARLVTILTYHLFCPSFRVLLLSQIGGLKAQPVAVE